MQPFVIRSHYSWRCVAYYFLSCSVATVPCPRLGDVFPLCVNDFSSRNALHRTHEVVFLFAAPLFVKDAPLTPRTVASFGYSNPRKRRLIVTDGH